jgi:hypothetical protein
MVIKLTINGKEIPIGTAGGVTGTVDGIKEDFIKFLNREFLYSFRKSFGMFGQIQWWVTDVDTETLKVHIELGWRPEERSRSVESISLNVRNALLNVFQDLLPCPKIKINFRVCPQGLNHPEIEEKRELLMDFYSKDRKLPMPSSLVVIEPVFGEERVRERKRFEEIWELFWQMKLLERPVVEA